TVVGHHLHFLYSAVVLSSSSSKCSNSFLYVGASDPNLLKETNTLLRGFQEKLLSISSHTVLVSCVHFLNQRAHTLKTGLKFYLLCKHMQVPMEFVFCLYSMSPPLGV